MAETVLVREGGSFKVDGVPCLFESKDRGLSMLIEVKSSHGVANLEQATLAAVEEAKKGCQFKFAVLEFGRPEPGSRTSHPTDPNLTRYGEEDAYEFYTTMYSSAIVVTE